MPKEAHYQIENNSFTGGVRDGPGRNWAVNLTRMEATAIGILVKVAKLKRLVNLSGASSCILVQK